MKKRNEALKAKGAESTVFSDPKDKPESRVKKTSKAKIALWAVVAILVVFVAVPWGVVQIVKIANTKPKPTFNERLDRTAVFEEAAKVYALKTADGNDLEACNRILDALSVDDYCGEFTFTVDNTSDGVTVNFKFSQKHDSSRDEWFKMQMIRYSCAMLALVDNMQKVTWEYPDSGASTGGSFTRGDVELLLGYPAHLYGQSEKGVQLLLNDLGLDV
ncbi:MAG: DUF4825 domain-containing protein [Ruminococcaceae bacterium]|nr:DUF4825 domain-containing protein [Oscillospiraceae bacterium]